MNLSNKINNNKSFTRKNKLFFLKKNNNFNYPNNFIKKNNIKNIIFKYKNNNRQSLELLNKKVNIAGRIFNKRTMSKNSIFIDIKDNNYKIQIYINKNYILKNNILDNYKFLDIGDIIGIIGYVFKTYSNELSIKVINIYLLNKSLKQLPIKYNKLINKEECIRKRYLDILINDKSRKTFLLRIKIIKLIRFYLEKKNFLEVDTPILHPIVGGALAKPFKTYHKSLHMYMYLRIAPELYLKKLIIAGFNKIFEIGKNFRNEGISINHNPEFSMLELYIAYKDMNYLMYFLEKLINFILKELSILESHIYNNININLYSPFKKITMYDAIRNFLKINYNIKINNLDLINKKKINNILNILKIKKNFNFNGEILEYIFDKFIAKKIINPTFVYYYPIETSPLARCNDKNNKLVDRFELFIAGKEIANGFSELNDVEEQSKRFLYQLKYNKKNFLNTYDKNYIEALEYGLPPTAGLGIGLDRLIMILTNNNNIKDVILFPTLKFKL